MANKVGTLIKEARTGAGLTQEQLARKIKGLSAAELGKAERGETELTQAILKEIAKTTGVTQSSLLTAAKGSAPAAKKTTAAAKTTAAKSTASKKSATTAKKASSAKTTAAKKTAAKKTTAKKTSSYMTILLSDCTTLKYGMVNKKCVKYLQKFLQKKGYYKGYKIDGDYLKYTKQEVNKLQKAYKIKVSKSNQGQWDKVTRDYWRKKYNITSKKK